MGEHKLKPAGAIKDPGLTYKKFKAGLRKLSRTGVRYPTGVLPRETVLKSARKGKAWAMKAVREWYEKKQAEEHEKKEEIKGSSSSLIQPASHIPTAEEAAAIHQKPDSQRPLWREQSKRSQRGG